jgi:hypothetical protein
MLPLSSSLSRSNFMIALIAIAPLLYCASIFSFSANVPVGDDYSVLGFLNDFHSASGIGSKLKLLFSFHNEHRIVLTRVIMLLCEKLTGSVSFRTLNLIGNMAFLSALIVIGRMLRFRDDKLKWALLFLIALQPQPMKLMFYPMAGLTAYFGLLFSFLYLNDTLKESRWYPELFYYVMAVLTTASGIFLAILGIPVLLYQRRYLRAIIHLAVSVAVVLLYSPNSSNLPYLFEHPLTVVRFFLLLLGGVSHLPNLESASLQTIFGLLLLGYFAHFAWQGFSRSSPWFDRGKIAQLCGLLYLLMIIALIAIGRAAIYEGNLWQASLDGRYRIYSMLFLALCIIDFLGTVRLPDKDLRWWSATVATLALAFNLSWYAYSSVEMRDTYFSRVGAMQQWLSSRDIQALPIWGCPPEDAETNLTIAVKTGAYRP